MSQWPHVEAALLYAEEVVDGTIPACKWVKLACKRQLKDLTKKRWPYRFDPDKAEKICNYIELMPHTKGRWAGKKELIKLEPWQCFIFTTGFGWVNKKTGFRRFREIYTELPRKSGKSLIAAGIGNFCFTADDEYSPEVFCGATTEKQAWEVFKPAKIMAEKTPEMCEFYGVEIHAKNMSIPESGGKFEPVIGNPGDGASPSCYICDEYHEHSDSVQYDTMITGMGARDQALALTITTAGHNIAGPCYEKHQEVKKMLDGSLPNEELFGIIYTIDDEDSWDSVDALIMANPNMGISVNREWLVSQQRQAAQSSSKQNRFKTKHLNIWVSASSAWMNMLKWRRCQNSRLKIEDFKNKDCILALDLASKCDIAALVFLFPEVRNGKKHYTIFGKFFLPEAAVQETTTFAYESWAIDGYLQTTEGDELDFGVIREEVKKALVDFNVLEIAYDPWRATQLMQEIKEDANNDDIAIEYRNTVQNMSQPMYEVEAAVRSKRLHHDGNPVMNWMMSNVVAKIDAKDNIYPRKEKVENKIDGVISLIMAIGRALFREEEGESIYNETDLTDGDGEEDSEDYD
ncbi:MAG: terminase large subunit [Gammaproteobacteria bacterium]|nr:terminase large subunit [Gammaproteobacteria bacterium]MBL4898611.1 terminase large subunit [Colwellia sp.]